MRSLFLLFCCALWSLTGCSRADNIVIYGGSGGHYIRGYLAVLDLKSRGEVALAIRYPAPVDVGGGGISGHGGGDNRRWREQFSVAFANASRADLPIAWEYGTTTEVLVFNDRQFDLPVNSLAVIDFDESGVPHCSVTPISPEAKAAIEREFGKVDDADVLDAVSASE